MMLSIVTVMKSNDAVQSNYHEVNVPSIVLVMDCHSYRGSPYRYRTSDDVAHNNYLEFIIMDRKSLCRLSHTWKVNDKRKPGLQSYYITKLRKIVNI